MNSDAYNEIKSAKPTYVSQLDALQLHEICLKSHVHPRVHISQLAQDCRDRVATLCQPNNIHRAAGQFLQTLQTLKKLRGIALDNPSMTMAILHHYSTLMLEWQTFQYTHQMLMPDITSHMKHSILRQDC